MPGGGDVGLDLKYYLAIFLRHLPYILIIVLLGTAIGGTIAVLSPPVYRAEARLVVEPEQIPDELAASTVQVDASEQLEIIRQQILSRDILIEMANRLGIYEAEQSEAARRMTADEIVGDLRERIQIVTVGAAQGGGAPATIVNVSFEAPTSQLASVVANEVVTLILQRNVSMRTRTAGQTLDFFSQEVERLDRELVLRGDAIQTFQEANRDALPDSLEFRRNQLVSEQERLLELQRDEAALRDRRGRLVEIYESTGRVDLAEPEAALTQEERDLQTLRNQMSALLGVLSPTNPRIAVLQSQIDALEAQVAASQGQLPSEAEGREMSAFDIQLADLDSQLASIADQRQQIEANIAELQTSIQATPANALKLDELQRDFDNIRSQYDQAVQSRALAQTGEMIETLSRGQRITVIEQAVPPEEPIRPNRPLIAGLGVFGGLALGLGLMALLELSNRSIRRPVDLSSQLGIAPFGVVPLMRSRYDIRWRRIRFAVALLVAVVLIPGSLWIVHTRVIPLDLLMDRMIDGIDNLIETVRDISG
jgi:uncharacterized protein involved in exopolysaccharide biosynthesis